MKVMLMTVTGCALVLLTACGGNTPVHPTPLGSIQSTATVGGDVRVRPATGVMPVTGVLPSWIVNPETLPPGRAGKNNCTFPFSSADYQWDFHPDGGCWEHDGPEGWTRKQFQRVHLSNFAACGGGPGDATAIQVCRAGGRGQPSPCLIDPLTGPMGCARCVVNPTCH
jgi:hypothetical protein